METQNQMQPQVQTQPQGQIQPEQNFDVKGALSKFDKYNNTLLATILVVIGVISCIFYIVPLFDLNIMQRPIGLSLSALAAFGSLAKTIYQSSSSSGANASANIGYIAFSLIFSLAITLLPLIKQTKKYAGFACIPALINCIIFLMTYNAFSPSNPNSSSSAIFGSSSIFVSINFFGYIYAIGQIAAILIGALILYRNNEAKKAAAGMGMAIPMNAYQVPVQPTNTPQYPTVNPTPAVPTSNQPQAAENQPQAESQPQFCPSCGNQIEPGTKFCGNCGATIE
ncbi:zinc ribbon domain-containing protein [Lancefieldella rimae]|uniref:Zinc-ribbon domain-containing protein n=2 Tax=Lancefieldella rimae TaxID=1383 RepID=B9CM04_LANR4|nr:zinc ribbon domain-containing protein [Lancefieldella rimae]EEE17571.1 hypothetical protein ATORI0001_1340 [Lancefieldella rimae ATCC 49626]KRO02309.1 hypothetical protein IV60_GL000739 [Lancefieldella rimae]